MESMTQIPMAEKPSFGMPRCGHASFGVAHVAGQLAASTIPATGVATRAYSLAQGGVDFGTKRRGATGTPAWRPSDC